mmetsp:Transcript_23440/g.61196  ORF Transcript_23440/g.61196 Transcript_23440/m.61196 type:complete len:386 (+) Transcript_23440:58-1215(+)
MNWGAKQEEGGLVFLASGTRTRAGADGPAAVHVAALVRARALQNVDRDVALAFEEAVVKHKERGHEGRLHLLVEVGLHGQREVVGVRQALGQGVVEVRGLLLQDLADVITRRVRDVERVVEAVAADAAGRAPDRGEFGGAVAVHDVERRREPAAQEGLPHRGHEHRFIHNSGAAARRGRVEVRLVLADVAARAAPAAVAGAVDQHDLLRGPRHGRHSLVHHIGLEEVELDRVVRRAERAAVQAAVLRLLLGLEDQAAAVRVDVVHVLLLAEGPHHSSAHRRRRQLGRGLGLVDLLLYHQTRNVVEGVERVLGQRDVHHGALDHPRAGGDRRRRLFFHHGGSRFHGYGLSAVFRAVDNEMDLTILRGVRKGSSGSQRATDANAVRN